MLCCTKQVSFMLLNNKRIVPAALLTVLMLGAAGCENNPGNVSDNSAVSENTVSENVTLNLPAPVTYSGLDFSVPEGFTEAAGNTEDNKVYKGPMSVDDSYIAYRVSEKDPGDDYSIMTKEDMQAELNRDVSSNAAITEFYNEDLGEGVRRIKTRMVYRKDDKDFSVAMYIYVTDQKVFTLIYQIEPGAKWAADYEQSQNSIELVRE